MAEQLSNEQINAEVAVALDLPVKWTWRAVLDNGAEIFPGPTADAWDTRAEAEADLQRLRERASDVTTGWTCPYRFRPSTDANHARRVETVIQRRGLGQKYAIELVEVVRGRSFVSVWLNRGGLHEGNLFSIIHATPRQRCLAALAALEQQGEVKA